MTFSGFCLTGKNWKLSFLSFQIIGDIPSSLYLITETNTSQSSTSLFHFYASAKHAFFEKMREHAAERSGNFCFEKVIL